jgi:hypothetical protein
MSKPLLLGSLLVLASCAPAERSAEAPAPAPPPAAVEADRAVAGLRLPVAGEVFTIGDEQWTVEATSIAFPTESVQQDTQIIDVTVQARRLAAAPLEYLGQEPPG